MEHEKKKKRAREENDEAEITAGPSFGNNSNTAKKRDVYGKSLMTKEEKNKEVVVGEEKGCFKAWDHDSNLRLGVFDFPWLKDGVMSKSEEDHCFLDCEESFLSSLGSQDTTSFKADHGIDFCEEHGLCETPEGSLAHIPEDKLVEDLWEPFESSDGLDFEAADDVDSIWSSLLNKPL